MCRLALCGGGGAALADELIPSQSAIKLNKLSPSQSGLAINSNKLNSTQPTLALNSNKPTQSYLASNQSKLNPSRPSDKLNSSKLNLALNQNEQALKQSSPSKDLQGALLADASDSIGQAIEQSSQATADSAPQTYQLEQTVITATGYEQDIKYAPASISIVPKEEIVNRPIKDLGDIIESVPGVAIDTAKTGVSTINMRGMDEEYTLVLIDGKRISPSKGIDTNGYNSTAGYLPPLNMIERVEVIKGPASLRYGSEAMGGVINIITKKVPDKTTASIGLEARLQEHHSTWGNTYGFNGNIFHPINDKFSINLRGKISYDEENHIYAAPLSADGNRYGPGGYTCVPNYRNQNGAWVGTQCYNPYVMFAPSAYQVASVGGRLTFTPDEQNTIYLDTGFDFQRIGTLNTSPRHMGEKRDYEKFKVLLNHDGKYDFGDISSYLQYNVISRMSSLNKYHEPSKLAQNFNERQHSGLLYNPTISGASTFTTNFDFGKAGALILNAGPSFFYERSLNRDGGLDDKGYQIAVFGEGEYLPLDWLGLTAGARLNYINVQGLNVAPRAYLSFYPMSWLTLKAGFAMGFQTPDLTMRYDGFYGKSTTRWDYGNKDLEVEKSYNYEVSALIDTPFANFSLAGFITDYRDAIKQITDYVYGDVMPGGYVCENNEFGTSGNCGIYTNVEKAQLWGAEFAMNSKAFLTSLFTKWNGGIYVDISYAYTDTEQKSGTNKGEPLNNVPMHSLTTKLTYKTPSWQLYAKYRGTLKKPTSNISVSAGYEQYVPKFYKDLHMVDLGTSYRFSNDITLSFVVNNLLDIDTTRDFFMRSANSARFTYDTMIPGRNYWLSVSADF